MFTVNVEDQLDLLLETLVKSEVVNNAIDDILQEDPSIRVSLCRGILVSLYHCVRVLQYHHITVLQHNNITLNIITVSQ